LNRSAVRTAVARAQSPVVNNPTTRVRAPRPAITHQPECVATANPLPIAPTTLPPAIAPITATPSVIPTWRLVEATAAATPACAEGIPETAVLVIGGVISPSPTPNTKYVASRNGAAVEGASPVSISGAMGIAPPPATIGRRAP